MFSIFSHNLHYLALDSFKTNVSIWGATHPTTHSLGTQTLATTLYIAGSISTALDFPAVPQACRGVHVVRSFRSLWAHVNE